MTGDNAEIPRASAPSLGADPDTGLPKDSWARCDELLIRGNLQNDVGSWPNGIKIGKAKKGGYSEFRHLQSNDFAILTLFRA
jgi:hypothetical protein